MTQTRSRATRLVGGIGVVLLALYVPTWWGLVFTGYYRGVMSPEMLASTKHFLPADLVLGALLVCTLVGLRRKRTWGYACGWMICGALIYVSIYVGVGIVRGSLPRDALTQLIVWPYLLAGVVGAVTLLKEAPLKEAH